MVLKTRICSITRGDSDAITGLNLTGESLIFLTGVVLVLALRLCVSMVARGLALLLLKRIM